MSPTARRNPPPQKAPWLLETIVVLLLLLNMFLSVVLLARSAPSAPALFGVMLAPAVIGLIVIGVASIFEGARNRRSRAKILLVTMLLILLGNCGNLSSMARRGELAAPADTSESTP